MGFEPAISGVGVRAHKARATPTEPAKSPDIRTFGKLPRYIAALPKLVIYNLES